MRNIVLIGMPGSGKSTTGVILAKTLGVEFVDIDRLIQKTTGKLLYEIIETEGIEAFLDIEMKTILAFQADSTVIATGGSAVLREESMLHLHKHSITVYLDVPFPILEKRIHNIKTRGIAADADLSLADIYRHRKPFYEKYADLTVPCGDQSVEDNVALILQCIVDFCSDCNNP